MGVFSVNKVAAGYPGVSERGLPWQGACHLPLFTPRQVTRLCWPCSFQECASDGRERAGSGQGAFTSHQFCLLSLEGLGGAA